MKTRTLIYFLFSVLLSIPALYAKSDNTEQQSLIVRGRILAADTRAPLINASITVERLKVSSVSNQDGFFSLRIPESARDSRLLIRHLGYENRSVSVISLLDNPGEDILLLPSFLALGPLEVVSGDGRDLVVEALRRIPDNYATTPEMMIAFYREHIKKNNNYISLVEAVLDVYKSSYKSFAADQAKIYIGRKATDISPRDTVLMKFQGGISTALLLDVAKNPGIVFGEKGDDYIFHIERMININDKPHYIINFEPLPGFNDILFRGTIYLDAEKLAFARMEFNMNVEGRKDAAAVFIRKKPAKMKADVEEAKYIVDYIESDGRWHFNYSSTEVRFKVRWTNRLFGLFSTNYAIGSEIAMTDRYENGVNKFPRKERIRSSDVIAEKVEYFQDPDFWGDYNVIEPDIEISKAIKKLSGKLLRRSQ